MSAGNGLLHGVAHDNFCDGNVKFRRGKLCAGGYVGSTVDCHVGWLHFAAGGPLQGLDDNLGCMKKSTIVVVTKTS